MLDFNHEHKGVELSAIKSKTEKAKKAGKIMLCGVSLSAVLLLSGCGNSNDIAINQYGIEQPVITSTAIIMENGNAMLVDVIAVKSYKVDSESGMTFKESDRTYVLITTSGDKLLVDYDSFKLISAEDSHEKAEAIAQSLISENGKVTCYDEIETFGKAR